jgi:hypothetical protein
MRTKAILTVLIVLLSSCKSISDREKGVLAYSEEKTDAYEKYLVRLEQYTSDGLKHHKKYRHYLIGVAKMIADDMKLNLIKNSIGFYFDKKSKNIKNLYLGLDIEVREDRTTAKYKYGSKALYYLKKHLIGIMQVIFSCESIFMENDVVGTVIGLRWQTDGENELINIWIERGDIRLLESKKLTLHELIERSVITNTKGNVIRVRQ